MGFFNQASPLAAALFFASVASAQVAMYGQCGGSGFTGSTTCVSGAVCQYQNDFYSQCVEGTATSVAAGSSAVSTAQTTAFSSAAASQAPSAVVPQGNSTTLSTSIVKLLTSSSTPVAVTSVRSSSTLATSIAKVAATTSVAAVNAATSATAATASASSSASSGTKYLMVFGDSYSSDGFWPGSETPSSEAPLGVASPGTTTDAGLNWLGVTATELNTSLTLGFDYAEYGATTDNSLVSGATNDLIAQVTEFQTYTAHNASDIAWTSDNTMAVVWMGINDVGNSFWDNFETPFETVLDQYFTQLQNLYDAGIRYFTLFMIPPFDQAPVFQGQTTQDMDYVRSNISTYNADLVTRLATFKSANTGVTGTVFNTSESFWTALDDPSAYNATDATCMNADGTTCLWYDTYHPGQAIQKLVAQNFVTALTGTFF
ncbi:carbohydrate esterase family 16 protein [Coleophoma crateriformis]|uniref:Carbohydrate esterase family 16 protein n=1 Tax=Coleophoma crateriformis TaxID=565419 RepID=A0A3D8RVQ3_9HELO|nr:carbohydrate esterase family 16 protein [Coleophoma crateriformis]